MTYYTVFLDFDNAYLPIKDMESGSSISISQPTEGEELTVEEAQARFKYLTEKCPNRHFIIRDSKGRTIEPDVVK